MLQDNVVVCGSVATDDKMGKLGTQMRRIGVSKARFSVFDSRITMMMMMMMMGVVNSTFRFLL